MIDTGYTEETLVDPIDACQQLQVKEQTENCLQHACKLLDLDYLPIAVSFDLRGHSAGMYQVSKGKCRIRFNPYIFSKYFSANLQETVPHEVAHHVADRLFGLRHIRPHGNEWKMIMLALGARPRVTADFDLSGVPMRRQRRFTYRCHCREYQLTSSRHNKICRNQASYLCRQCGTTLILDKAGKTDF